MCLEGIRATPSPKRRPQTSGVFNIVIVGGGSFGASIAEQLFQLDIPHKRHRILVLEGGPMLLPEHVQNLPPSLDINEVSLERAVCTIVDASGDSWGEKSRKM